MWFTKKTDSGGCDLFLDTEGDGNEEDFIFIGTFDDEESAIKYIEENDE